MQAYTRVQDLKTEPIEMGVGLKNGSVVKCLLTMFKPWVPCPAGKTKQKQIPKDKCYFPPQKTLGPRPIKGSPAYLPFIIIVTSKSQVTSPL